MKAPDIVFLNDKTLSLGCREKQCDIFNTEFRRMRELTDEECDALIDNLNESMGEGYGMRHETIRAWYAKLNGVNV